MANVTFVPFNQFYTDEKNKVHNQDADTFKAAFVTSALTLTAALADPRWGAGGSNDLSANEVSAVSPNYATGGIDISSAITISGSTITFDGTVNPSWTQDAVDGFTDARYFVVYNDTAAGKNAVGFGDLATNQSLAANDLVITFDSLGIIVTKDQ